MRKIFAIIAGLLMLTACGQNTKKAVVDNETTTITWIEDIPGPSVRSHETFPDVPDSLWNALGLQDGVPSSMSCFLLQTKGKTILLDAGLGSPDSQLIPKLGEMGIAPEDLELIYISHFHGDHIGGLVKDGEMVFPNAELYMNRVEAEAWLAMDEGRNAQVREMMSVYEGHIHYFEAGDMLEGDVKTIAAYGHTPGHTVFQAGDILVIADLIHGAALQLEYPEYCPTFDMDPEAATEARIRILKYARENGLTMYGMHVPAPGSVE